ncbi:MAG: response regulator [Bacteroidales bacterium]|nr:response regulator [Bacteroidales bacterium]
MKKILAIDDNESNLMLIKSNIMLMLSDCDVMMVKSGEEGIKIAREELPDAILLDIVMPGMNGFQVCEILKNDPKTKHIPILLVSALGHNTSDRIKGLNMGAEAFITKPFDNTELISQVKVLLRIKNAEDLLRKQNNNLEIFIKKQTKDFTLSETRFLQITEYAQEYFWEVDENGKYTYVSAVIAKILGFEDHDVMERKYLFDFPQLIKNPKSDNTLREIFGNRANYKAIELLCVNKAGKKIWLMVSGFPIYDKDSTFLGYRGVTQDITLRRQAEEDLNKSLKINRSYQLKLKKLNSELVKAEEKERRRIAEYLHDGIGQVLSITHFNLSSLKNKKLPTDIQRVISNATTFLSDAINQSRLLTYDLSPPVLYELGLVPAIRWKLEQIKNNHNLQTEIDATEPKIALSSHNRILLYRIICELLINVIKHAQAGRITVEISNDLHYQYFSVTDDGQGFKYSTSSNKSGYGLFSVNERLDTIQGRLVIKSDAGKGTTATVILPIKKS